MPDTNAEQPGYAELFGQVTRSATHEIKNELAVINEQSHLISEMLELAAKGREPDPARLHQLIGRVIERVSRADQAVRRLNAFAHTAEENGPPCDAVKCVELMCGLFARQAALHGVTLEQDTPDAMSVGLSSLDCQRLVWRCLATVVEAAARGSVVRLSLASAEDGALLRFGGQMEGNLQTLPPELLEQLGVVARGDGGVLALALPPARARGG
jgi:signal transduction histidine kinase